MHEAIHSISITWIYSLAMSVYEIIVKFCFWLFRRALFTVWLSYRRFLSINSQVREAISWLVEMKVITRATCGSMSLKSGSVSDFCVFLSVDIVIIAQCFWTCLANLQRAYLNTWNTFVRHWGLFLVLPFVELLKFT